MQYFIENIGYIIAGIIGLVIFCLYNKMFTVWYNGFGGLLTTLLICFLIGVAITEGIATSLGPILLFILKWGAIIGVGVGTYKFIQNKRHNKVNNTTTESTTTEK